MGRRLGREVANPDNGDGRRSTIEWLELTEAIEFVGPLIFPQWTGHERHAPTPRELNAEIARLDELTPEQLAAEYDAWQAGIDAEAERQRAARKAAGDKPSGIREALEKLRLALASATNEARRRALQSTIDSLSGELERADSRNQTEHERDQFIIGLLTERIEAAYQPGLGARQRWWEAHAAIDDAGRAGRIRARACRPGLPPVPFGMERWPEIFPAPGESRAIVDGIPARIFLAKTDLEIAFAKTDPLSDGQHLEPQKGARQRLSDAQRLEPQREARQSRESHHPTRDRSRQLMEKDIAEGIESVESIGEMTEEYRAERYGGVSRETARLAWRELVGRQTPTSSG